MLGDGNPNAGTKGSNFRYQYATLKLLEDIKLNTAIINLTTSQTGIVAHAGGGQADATQLTAAYNRVDTITSDGDSVKVGFAVVNARYVVQNNGANALDVFPMPGDHFLGQADNTAFSVAAGNMLVVFCFTNGEWTPQ